MIVIVVVPIRSRVQLPNVVTSPLTHSLDRPPSSFSSLAEIVSSSEDIDFQSVFQKISEENFKGLPQGGGIFAK